LKKLRLFPLLSIELATAALAVEPDDFSALTRRAACVAHPSPEVLFYRAMAFTQVEEYSRAADDLMAHCAMLPMERQAQAFFVLCPTLLKAQRYEEAASHYATVRERFEEVPPVWNATQSVRGELLFQQGVALSVLGRHNEAIEVLLQVRRER